MTHEFERSTKADRKDLKRNDYDQAETIRNGEDDRKDLKKVIALSECGTYLKSLKRQR